MPNQSPEEQKESEVRRDLFFKRYGELVEDCKYDFANYPVWVPDGQGGFKTVIQSTPVDTKNMPQKSPFVVPEK